MKTINRIFFVFMLAAFLIFVFYSLPTYRNIKGEDFLIENGNTAFLVAQRLKKMQLIKSKWFFIGLVKLTGQSRKLQKGLYHFSGKDSTLKIFWKIVRGQIYTIRVTIPEGYSIWQIDELLSNKGITESKKFLNFALKNNLYKKIIYLPNSNLEGFLFPNTYAFPKNANVTNIALTMVKEFSNMIIKRYKNELKNKNLYKILKMASLIEKEAKVRTEQPIISQVFWRRLKKGMKLGCDPTVAYAVKKFKGERILYRDLRFDSPFNTYLYEGLPPTPIANPGVHAFDAALHPANSTYLYFVAKNDGTHYFSKNLKEHNKAVEKYQR